MIQPPGASRLATMPAVHTTESQTAATIVLIELSCMSRVYMPSPHGAVPERTPRAKAKATSMVAVDNRTDAWRAECLQHERGFVQIAGRLWPV
jgi:hypothetical protein